MLAPTFHCLPNQGINESKVHPLAAIVHYGRIENEKASMILIALFEERTKSINQKRVTSNRFFLDHFHLNSHHSLVITSPKWRPSVDESQSKLNKSLRKSSHADEPFSSFTRLSRFSLHSISYGFGLGTKIRKSTPPDANLSPANTYRLPSNKIELDSNQQELLRRSGSLKKSM